MRHLFSLALLFIVSCSNEDNTYVRCQNVDDFSHEQNIILTKDRFIEKTYLVFGKDCDPQIARDFENRFEYHKTNGEIRLLVHELTPLTDRAVQYFNRTKECNKSDWKINQPRNMIEAGCTEVYKANARIYPYGSGIEIINDGDSKVFKKKR